MNGVPIKLRRHEHQIGPYLLPVARRLALLAANEKELDRRGFIGGAREARAEEAELQARFEQAVTAGQA